MLIKQDNIRSISNLQTFRNQKRTGTYHNAIHASSLFLREIDDPSETLYVWCETVSCVTI